jgi:two-component system sensor histidine kinase and response regulator WspE
MSQSQNQDRDLANLGDLSSFSMMDLFRMEADGQARTLTDGLLAMESKAGNPATVESLMRAAHSIKGAAAIVGLDVVVQLAHAMEDAFVAAQHGRLQLTPARIDVLLAGVDLIVQCSRVSEAGVAGWLGEHADRIAATMASIAQVAQLREAPPLPAVPAPAPAQAAVELFEQFEPFEPFEPFAPATPAAPAEPAEPAEPGALGAPRAAMQNYDRLLALASETRINAHQLVPTIASLQRFKRNQASLVKAVEQLHEALVRGATPALAEQCALVLQKTHPLKQFLHGHMADIDGYERRVRSVSDNLVDEVLALRMRPFRDGVHAFGRMVRDLARSLGKEAQLTITGEDTPVDRDILAEIEGPLGHMLRNAVDHGIEAPGERRAAGKPAAGAILLEARHRNGMLSIVVSDDGHGVDFDKIRRSIVTRKLASASMAEAMSKAELMEFLFLPAFTLKETATAVSGRGVGLDIVLQAIRAQNGSVRMESEPGKGLRTSITLPLTQSIVRALVVDVGGEAYAIPIVKVERVLRLARADLHTLEGKQFFDFAGEHLGLVSAAQVLELGQVVLPAGELAVVVIGAGARRYALAVDAIRGEQSLAVQPLDAVFGKLRDIASAALLDDGAPVLILDVADLLLSIDKLLREGGLHQLAQPGELQQRQARRILVVDDSLTVREMEKKLLQGRGYQVDIAIDGVDGWNVVRSGAYDLVITDVDMPRMDGVELVGMIRKDIHLHKLPVMIVSYKDRPEDRARGMTAGADYYLAKGSFHDETLLDAVFDLIGESGA